MRDDLRAARAKWGPVLSWRSERGVILPRSTFILRAPSPLLRRPAKLGDGALVLHEIARALGLRRLQVGKGGATLVAHEVPLRDVEGRLAKLVALALRVPVGGRR